MIDVIDRYGRVTINTKKRMERLPTGGDGVVEEGHPVRDGHVGPGVRVRWSEPISVRKEFNPSITRSFRQVGQARGGWLGGSPVLRLQDGHCRGEPAPHGRVAHLKINQKRAIYVRWVLSYIETKNNHRIRTRVYISISKTIDM